jgi:Zn-dependent protease
MIAAQRKGCVVWSIELYPVCGITRFDAPYSRYDHCVMAWGGVLAQAAVAIPLIVGIKVFGYSCFESINAFAVILGFFSLSVAAFNLLPIRVLDGAIAWGLLSALSKRRVQPSKKPKPVWRSYR